MALQVASLYGVLSLDDSGFNRGLNNAKSGLSDLGGNLQRTGGQISLAAAPIAGLFGVATNQAINFDEAVTNTGAILGYTRDQIDRLALDLLEISGGNTRAGPQAVAEAFYDIVGGVQDATTHMAILDAAIMTSQAGNAQLAGTTKALISTMNSYQYSADQAAMVSDVLTQTVGMGVGSMDEFAAALPQVTGLAASLGIPLENVGSMMAFLTTKGNTASQAATQLGANMSALMKPNEQMKDALAELGFNSGEAAIEQMGLLGALQAVAATATAQTEGMAALLGTQEAVRGSTSLMGQDFLGFNRTFVEGVAGITAATEQIQMGSAAAEMDLFNSQLSQMAIIAGYALVPALLQMLDTVRPIVTEIISWISQNPELTAQIGILAFGAVGLGAVLAGVGLAVSTLGTLLGILLSPVVLLAGAIAGLVFAASQLYPGGLSKLLSDAAVSAQTLGQILQIILVDGLNKASLAAQNIVGIIMIGFNLAVISAQTIVNGFITSIQNLITENQFLFDRIQDLILAIGIMRVGLIAHNLIVGISTAVTSGLATASSLAAAATGAITLAVSALLSPVVTVTAAIWALISAYRELQKFQDTVKVAGQNARNVVAPMVTSGQITPQQVRDQAFASAQSQFTSMLGGSGFLGDLATRMLGDNFINSIANAAGANAIPGRAGGGDVMGGQSYLVGEQGPELFTPGVSGYVSSNGDTQRMMGNTYNITINASTEAGGRAAGRGFLDVVRARGG